MKIGQKISLGFAFAMLALIVSMGTSIYNIFKLYEIVEDINNDKVVEFSLSQDLLSALDRQRILIRDLVINDDQKESINLANSIRKVNDEIDGYLDTFKMRITTQNGKELFETITKADVKYRNAVEKTIQLNLALKKDESVHVIINELTPVGSEYSGHVKSFLQHVTKLMDEKVVEASEAYESSKIVLAILLIAGVLVMIGLTIALSRSITSSIRKAVKVADSIAVGDLNVDLTSKSKDETATLMKSLGIMVDNIGAVIKENNLIADNSNAGNFSYRADSSKFLGEYKELVNGTNSIVDALAIPLTQIRDLLQKFSKGELPDMVPATRGGDFNQIRSAINELITTLHELDTDASNVIAAIKQGNLITTRADADKHKGIFRDIMLGYNNMLELIVSSLDETMSVIDRLANGDLKARMVKDYKGDFNTLKTNLNASFDSLPLDEIQGVMEAMASGDLTVAMVGNYQGDNLRIKEAVNNTINSLNQILNNVKTTVDEVTHAAVQVSDTSQALSQGATEQAASLEEITSSMNEIGGQTKLNAENAGIANTLATNARDAAEKGNSEMSLLTNAMNEINTSSQSISKIIKVIDDIAFQTNLLALNAAVEAARAGRHGKGFAVVAEEVRSLAARSAKAASETSEMIENSIKTVDRGAELVEKTGEALKLIQTESVKVADIIGEITTSSNEQAQGIAQINEGLNQIDKVTQTNTASAEESASAAEELSGQATQLHELVDRFKLNRTLSANTPARKSLPAYSSGRRTLTSSVATPLKESDFSDFVNLGGSDTGVNPNDIINLGDDEFGRY